MSVSLITVRTNICHQFRNYPEMSFEEVDELEAEWYYSPDSGFWVLTEYRFIQIITAGWSGGAFMRTKNLSMFRAQSYVNKLHQGKWIDDSTYNTMYTLVDELVRRFDWDVPSFGSTDSPDDES